MWVFKKIYLDILFFFKKKYKKEKYFFRCSGSFQILLVEEFMSKRIILQSVAFFIN